MQQGYKIKSKLKKLLQQCDQTKTGVIHIEAFFQMLELHDMHLTAEDKHKLK